MPPAALSASERSLIIAPFAGENLTVVTHRIVYEAFTPAEDLVAGLALLPALWGLRALLRRGTGVSVPVMSYGALSFDPASRTASIDGHPLSLSVHELNVLEVLIRRFGRVVSKEQLVEQIYTYDQEVSHNAIEVYMHRLRKKIGGTGVIVRTLYGRGYALDYVES